MRTKQTNDVTMFKTVDDYLDSYNAVWNTMAAFVTADQSLKDKISAIDTAAQEQEAPSGAADAKEAARDDLAAGEARLTALGSGKPLTPVRKSADYADYADSNQGNNILGSPTASDTSSSIEGSRLLSNPKGWEKVAGGRSEAKTSGSE